MTVEKLTKIAILRKCFSTTERPLDLKEIKALSMEERVELAELAAKELNVEIIAG